MRAKPRARCIWLRRWPSNQGARVQRQRAQCAGSEFDASNYDIGYADGTLMVNKAGLVVTAVVAPNDVAGSILTPKSFLVTEPTGFAQFFTHTVIFA